MNEHTENRTARDMLNALEAIRDQARVRAHLLSMDAKARWRKLEDNLLDLQEALDRGGERVAATASTTFVELTEAVTDFVREIDGAAELAVPVRRIMNAAPLTCTPEDSLNRAAQIMWDADCGVVPVVDGEGAVVGLVTDRDVCMAAYTRGQQLGAMNVASVMASEVHSCSPDDSLRSVLRMMGDKKVRRLPVVAAGKLVGIVSLGDIAREVRPSSSIPACVALAHALGSISGLRQGAPGSAEAAQ